MNKEEFVAVLIYNGIIVKEIPIYGPQQRIQLAKPYKPTGGWGNAPGVEELMSLRCDEFWYVCQKDKRIYYHNV